ncbi:MAG: hexose kinase [Acidobacteria bacterium]|nr:hexose kinase [Acidobacteriota bacterium]
MILTVTPNTALDQVIEIPHYVPGFRLHILKETECIGGKGNLASGFIADLGAKTVSLGFAAGRNGHRLAEMLRVRGAPPDFTPARGETRRLLVVVDERRQVQTWLVPATLHVNRKIERDLEQCAARWLPKSSWLALCGSLPLGCSPGIYRRLVRLAHSHRVPVLVDARGPALSNALPVRPEVVRLNKEELELTLGKRITSLPAIVRELRRIVAGGVEVAVCSLGADGAVAATAQAVWQFLPPKVRQKSSAGSGDAFTAAILVWRERGAEWLEAILWACAAGAAKAMHARTDHPLDLAAVRRKYRDVNVRNL